jgi:hypothetical protein
MVRTLVGAVRFFWAATAGHRLRPWRSEYLRWRVETYSGKPAGTLRLRDFLQVFLAEPRQFVRFFGWSGRMRRIAGEGGE